MNLLKIILITLGAIAQFGFAFYNTALAVDINNGAKIFTNNCASCHIGGGNILLPKKNLGKAALSEYLENYDTNSLQAIIYQVTNGKNAMPAFKNKLTEPDILEVATFVFQQAEQGW
ncbi:MAG: c-type cytochrome [Methylacidiphilales bacterium]|nr:c-type cytochrome [Candidatus Methylacidiphilales bacterium]NJR19783.1 c-type cytochrome [Calothrix sp. CSU_2_0]